MVLAVLVITVTSQQGQPDPDPDCDRHPRRGTIEPLDPTDMRREYPGSISWFRSHQLTAALVIVFVIVVLVVAGFIGTAAVSGQLSRGG